MNDQSVARSEDPDEAGLWDDLDAKTVRADKPVVAEREQAVKPVAKTPRNIVSRGSTSTIPVGHLPVRSTAHPAGMPAGHNPYLITGWRKLFHWLGMETSFLVGLWIGCAVMAYQVLATFEFEFDPVHFAIGAGVLVLVILLAFYGWCRGKLNSRAKAGALVWLTFPGVLLVVLFLAKVIPAVLSGETQ